MILCEDMLVEGFLGEEGADPPWKEIRMQEERAGGSSKKVHNN